MNNFERNKNIEICLEECKGVLNQLSYKYKSLYNGDTGEAFANACLWLVELYDKFDKDKASFVTYIYHVIENKFISEYRKQKICKIDIVSKDVYELDEMGALPNYFDNNDYSDYEILSDGQVDRYNIYLEYCKYLDNIKEKERDIFKLFYYNMWDISSIANAYDLSEIRVKEIKRNALNKLKEYKEIEKFY